MRLRRLKPKQAGWGRLGERRVDLLLRLEIKKCLYLRDHGQQVVVGRDRVPGRRVDATRPAKRNAHATVTIAQARVGVVNGPRMFRLSICTR